MSATVTVVVRTRNRPAMLTRALASIASQTFDDYEVVIVNDAGDEAEVRSIVKKQKSAVRSKITIVTNKVSKGREAALESGLAASHNRYYAVHDDDDSWHPHFLKKTVAYLDEHPKAGGVATRCEIVRERVRADGTCIEIEREVLSTDNYGLSLVDMMVENYTPPISQLIRREVADRVGHWDGSLQTQADWDFNLRLLADSPVGFIDGEPLAYWHHRDTMDASWVTPSSRTRTCTSGTTCTSATATCAPCWPPRIPRPHTWVRPCCRRSTTDGCARNSRAWMGVSIRRSTSCTSTCSIR